MKCKIASSHSKGGIYHYIVMKCGKVLSTTDEDKIYMLVSKHRQEKHRKQKHKKKGGE